MFNNVQLPTIKTHNVCTILYNVWLTTAQKKERLKENIRAEVVGHCAVVVVVVVGKYNSNYDEIL